MWFAKLFRRRASSSLPQPKTAPPSPNPVYKRMFEQQPWFFGVLFAAVFLEPRLGIEKNELERLVSGLPENLRPDATMWISVYLAYVLFELTAGKYGRDFADDALSSMGQTNPKLKEGERIENLDEIAKLLEFWFPRLDIALNGSDAPQEMKDAPLELVAAATFMNASPDGPLFVQGGEFEEICVKLAEAFAGATEQTLEKYKRAVEIGAPLEELGARGD
ncbi:MAG: hypothetical protein JO253_07070 [Alphaproteobacteria bacterium]|nr:hypothetical protein [Alphaproteobacteria bacterium]